MTFERFSLNLSSDSVKQKAVHSFVAPFQFSLFVLGEPIAFYFACQPLCLSARYFLLLQEEEGSLVNAAKSIVKRKDSLTVCCVYLFNMNFIHKLAKCKLCKVNVESLLPF